MGNLEELAVFAMPSLKTSVIRGLAVPLPNQFPKPPQKFAFEGTLLMIDQALAKSGWAIFKFQGGNFTEITRGIFRASVDLKGHQATLETSVHLSQYFVSIMQFLTPFQYSVCKIVHEMPPVGGAMARPESSLVAATAIRCAADRFKIPVAMIGAQAAKKRWTGNGNAKKSEVRKAILEAYPEFAYTRPWNQDICDAIALGLTWAENQGSMK